MLKTILIYAHKTSIGATSDIESGTFLNDVTAEGQMGVVVNVKDIAITSKALKLMKESHTRAGGSFSGIMLNKGDNGASNVGLLGFGLHGIAIGEPTEFSRDCDLSVLDEIRVDDDITVPTDFIKFVDEEVE